MGSGKALLVACSVLAVAPFAMAASAGEHSASTASKAAASHLLVLSDQDGDTDVYGMSADGRRLAALTRNRVRDESVVTSPNGRWFAVERGYGPVVLVSANGRRERKLARAEVAAAFSPNGRLLAVAGDLDWYARMSVVQVDSGRAQTLGLGMPLSFSPDGRMLAWDDAKGRGVGITRLPGLSRRILPGTKELEDVKWSPDSMRLAFHRVRESVDGRRTYTLLALAVRRTGARPTAILTGGESFSTEWLRGGKLGYSRDEGELGVVAPSGGRPLVIEDAGAEWPEWSPQGDRVAYTRTVRGDERELVVASTDGGQKRVLLRGAFSPDYRWSPSGRLLAVVASKDVLVLNPGAGTSTPVVRGLSRAGLSGWSPDDDHFAFTRPQGVAIASARTRAVRTVPLSGNYQVVGWVRGALPPSAPKAPPPPPVETATNRLLSSRGKITEIAADGARVAALVAKSRLDCDHVVGWTPAKRAIFRAQRPWICDLNQTWFNLSLVGRRLRWQDYYCGNYCHLAEVSADFGKPYGQRYGDEVEASEGFRPVRPLPPRERHRGVAITVERGTITLRRDRDGRTLRIRPRGSVVDAELEDDGLYYAFNDRKAKLPGRIVFVPFAQLLG